MMNQPQKKMSSINKLAAAVLIVGMSAPFMAHACHHGDGEKTKGQMCPDKMEKRLDHMTENLSLSDSQREQIKAIMASQSAERQALKAQLKALRKSQKEAIKAVLTPEQQAKMAEMHKKKHKH